MVLPMMEWQDKELLLISSEGNVEASLAPAFDSSFLELSEIKYINLHSFSWQSFILGFIPSVSVHFGTPLVYMSIFFKNKSFIF